MQTRINTPQTPSLLAPPMHTRKNNKPRLPDSGANIMRIVLAVPRTTPKLDGAAFTVISRCGRRAGREIQHNSLGFSLLVTVFFVCSFILFFLHRACVFGLLNIHTISGYGAAVGVHFKAVRTAALYDCGHVMLRNKGRVCQVPSVCNPEPYLALGVHGCGAILKSSAV